MQLSPDGATCRCYAGIDPFTKKPVNTAKNLGDRKPQRALMQFFKSENYISEVREALIRGSRGLIGGCEGLIPANPPREAIEARRKQANRAVHGNRANDHSHSIANPAKGEKPGERNRSRSEPNGGYRPGRKSQKRTRRGKRNEGYFPSFGA